MQARKHTQRQARNASKTGKNDSDTGKERLKGRQGKTQTQARILSKASKITLKREHEKTQR